MYGGSTDVHGEQVRAGKNCLSWDPTLRLPSSPSGELVPALFFFLMEREEKGEIGCCWLSLSGQRGRFISLGIFSHDRSNHLGFGLSSSIFVCNAQKIFYAVQVHVIV